MSLRVREAVPGDVPAVGALLDALVAAGLRTRAAGVAAARDDYVENPRRILCSVAEGPDGVVGLQILTRAWAGNPYDAPVGQGIVGTHVHPRAHGLGAGRALFARTREAARAAGLDRIEAYIQTSNTQGHGYYAAMGFHEDRTHGTALIRVHDLA